MRFLRVQPAAARRSPSSTRAGYFERDFRCGRSEARYVRRGRVPRREPRPARRVRARCARRAACSRSAAPAAGCCEHAAERGWERAASSCRRTRSRTRAALGLDVFDGDAARGARCPAACFDLVYLGDVLEHVPDCRATLAEVARVLRPAGTSTCAGRSRRTRSRGGSRSPLYEAPGATIVLREPPYHLWEFTPGSLDAAVSRGRASRWSECGRARSPRDRPTARRPRSSAARWRAIDAVNVPITRTFNALGDRVTVTAQKP